MVEYNYEPGFEESGLWDFIREFPEVTFEDNKVWGWRNGEYIEITEQYAQLPNVIHFGVEGPDPEDLARKQKATANEARRVMRERAQAVADHWGIPLVDMSYVKSISEGDKITTPSVDFLIDFDGSIINNETGERYKMATTIRTTEDLSTLTDEQLAEQEKAFRAEAQRRAEEQARRIREAKPAFQKFQFNAQYPDSWASNGTALARVEGHGLKKYSFVGQQLDDGRVYITGQISPNVPMTFTSWAAFEEWARQKFYWMSRVRKLTTDTTVPTYEVKRRA